MMTSSAILRSTFGLAWLCLILVLASWVAAIKMSVLLAELEVVNRKNQKDYIERATIRSARFIRHLLNPNEGKDAVVGDAIFVFTGVERAGRLLRDLFGDWGQASGVGESIGYEHRLVLKQHEIKFVHHEITMKCTTQEAVELTMALGRSRAVSLIHRLAILDHEDSSGAGTEVKIVFMLAHLDEVMRRGKRFWAHDPRRRDDVRRWLLEEFLEELREILGDVTCPNAAGSPRKK